MKTSISTNSITAHRSTISICDRLQSPRKDMEKIWKESFSYKQNPRKDFHINDFYLEEMARKKKSKNFVEEEIEDLRWSWRDLSEDLINLVKLRLFKRRKRKGAPYISSLKTLALKLGFKLKGFRDNGPFEIGLFGMLSSMFGKRKHTQHRQDLTIRDHIRTHNLIDQLWLVDE